MGWQTIVDVIGKLITVGIGLAESLGQRDAFISALDATFAAARAVNDRDLDAKHRGASNG